MEQEGEVKTSSVSSLLWKVLFGFPQYGAIPGFMGTGLPKTQHFNEQIDHTFIPPTEKEMERGKDERGGRKRESDEETGALEKL